MKKYLLPALALSMSATLSFGQATLTAATTNPYLGDVYANINCDTTNVTPGPAGAGQTWNFGALIPTTTATVNDTVMAEACSLTPTCSLFSGSDMVLADVRESTYNYLATSSTKLQQKGYYNSPTQNAVFTDPIDQFRYPFTYNTSYLDTATGTITVTPSGGPTVIATEFVVDTVKCDGYGTLMLPGGLTYSNVLRVHSVQSFRDSANLFAGPIFTHILEQYTWYTPGYHSALLTVATATGLGNDYKLVTYSSKKIKTAVPEINETEASLKLAPNPATDMLNMSFNIESNQHVRVAITDMMGREAAVIADKDMQGVQHISYNTTALPRGLYIVRLQAANAAVSRKVELQ